jgi:Tol biopolymer transport system component
MPAGGGQERRVLADSADDRQPTWSPDSQSIAFASDAAGDWDIYTYLVFGGAEGKEPIPVTSGARNNVSPAWSR